MRARDCVNHLYWNIDYRVDAQPLPKDTLYFHAQYRQAQPNHGWTGSWYENGDPMVNYKRNLDGKDNYVWLEAQGHGQFIGVTMSVLQNQDGWFGEGDDMFQIDGDAISILGTGSEDYFLGAWGYMGSQDFLFHGAPVVGKEIAGERSSMYRFHFDSPIPFTKSIRASIEHGHANHRSDNYLLRRVLVPGRAARGVSAAARMWMSGFLRWSLWAVRGMRKGLMIRRACIRAECSTYSERSAATGSRLAALRAGSQLASAAITASRATANPRVTGS